ncbi:c6 zinc finger domain-containing protein [Dactylonectria macrodidyma]|uniref:C6 zinc finger domain-containing protein n=1 Tax=Dactylonectria macrodidyma TaxID=307937 RepID=A0A9P9F5Y6_9HYPO|nr:c6 zinc finger domain-containing protein [Dactylonectria macrodidyma]
MMDVPRESLSEVQSSGGGRYQCTQCQRTYTRVDHLARHVRSHLQERPFQCQTCQKCFGRADLLKRHMQLHEEDGSKRKRPRLVGPHQSRVSAACQACATAKVRCDDDKPCMRCQQLHIQCEFTGHLQATRTATKGPTLKKGQESTQLAVCGLVDLEPTGILERRRPFQSQAPSAAGSTNVQAHSAGDPCSSLEGTTNCDTPPFSDNQFSDFLRDVMSTPDTSTVATNGEANWSKPDFRHWNVLDFNMDDDAELNWPMVPSPNYFYAKGGSDMQWPWLDGLHAYYPPKQLQPVEEHLQQSGKLAPNRVMPKRQAGVGVEAFQKSSLSRWLPNQQDSTATHMNQLSVGAEEPEAPYTCISQEHRILSDPLTAAASNRLLAMILSTCDAEKGAAIAAAFPPRQLLGELVQNYMTQNRIKSTNFIHEPTFCPNRERPELLGAVIAAGAVLSDSKSLQEFGLAIQEALSLVVQKRCEKSNALTRELWLLQTLMLEIEIALWSGSKRKMEIAESQTHALFTMLRRSGGFQKYQKFVPPPLSQDSGAVLRQKWIDWVQQESYKRLSFYAFLLDEQLSMALLVSPQISYAEMLLPLPESSELWTAEDAERWKSIYLKHPIRPVDQFNPSMLSLLQKPLEISSLPSCYDLHLSTLIVLHGLWGMIWECTQLTSVFSSRLSHSSAAMTLHQDLCQAFDSLRMAVTELEEAQTPEVDLMLGLLTIYLHASLEKVQLFAGKEDLEEARRVFPLLQEWTMLPSARHAIWGAGQVLRAAKAFPARQLRNFQAIAVYHAGLTCWAYGIISLKNEPRGSDTQRTHLHSPATTIWLDGPDTSDVRRFIALGRGIPSIGFPRSAEMPSTGLISLSDPVHLMGVVLNTLQNNMEPHTGGASIPPLVENLIQLITDLGEAGLIAINNLAH